MSTVRFIPIVVIVPEDVLPMLNARTDAVAEQLASWADLKRRNGWSDEAIVAGTILANSLRLTLENGAA